MVAVPLQVALPLPAVALSGAAVAPLPRLANTRLVPPAMVLRPVRAAAVVEGGQAAGLPYRAGGGDARGVGAAGQSIAGAERVARPAEHKRAGQRALPEEPVSDHPVILAAQAGVADGRDRGVAHLAGGVLQGKEDAIGAKLRLGLGRGGQGKEAAIGRQQDGQQAYLDQQAAFGGLRRGVVRVSVVGHRSPFLRISSLAMKQSFSISMAFSPSE